MILALFQGFAPRAEADLLTPSVTLEVSGEPRQLDVADLNGDTFPDLLVPNYSTDEVTIHLGAGNGSFTPGPSLATGDGPVYAAAGDLNNDGYVDCVSANLLDGTASVRLGLGNGSFAPASIVPVGNNPLGLMLADLTEDGYLDILVTHEFNAGLTVNRSRGNGSFWSPFTISSSDHATRIQAADLNGDGHLDVITARAELRVYFGNGNGSTGAPVIYAFPVGGSAWSLRLADFNEDGNLDVAAPVGFGGNNPVSLWTWPGDGDGTFGAPTGVSPGLAIREVDVADIDQDGHVDAAISSWLENTITVFFGDGAGGWLRTETLYAPDPKGHRLADLDGNGGPDLAASLGVTDQVSVFLNSIGGASQVPGGAGTRLLPFAALPNPAIQRVEFQFRLDAPGPVALDLFDVRGRHLGRLAERPFPEGEHRIRWDGRSGLTAALPAGNYFVRLANASAVRSIPITWLGN